jgi:preprotein translocase subunit SecG
MLVRHFDTNGLFTLLEQCTGTDINSLMTIAMTVMKTMTKMMMMMMTTMMMMIIIIIIITKHVERPGDRSQQDVESEDKYCASYNWSIRNNLEGIRSEPSVATRSPVSHRATEGHTNEHCTQHW